MSEDYSKSKISTTALMKRLFKTNRLNAFMKTYNGVFIQSTFSEYIRKLCGERDMVCERVIRNAGIDRTYGHQLFSGRRNPSRDKVIQLAFGLLLKAEEAQELLKAAGKSPLYPKIKRDAAILYCLQNGVDFFDAQATLEEMGLPLMGREGRYE